MEKLKIGYAEVNINPPLGLGMFGYYIPRYGKGFLDDLLVSALVLSHNSELIAVISVDICCITTVFASEYREIIEKATGIKKENIFLTATHTHTGPILEPPGTFYADAESAAQYQKFLGIRINDAVNLAITDLKEGRVGYIIAQAPERVAYIRRYKMKDGTTMTCPPVNDPNIDHPIGTLDQRVNVLRFDREGCCSIVLVNYGIHTDTVNGEMFSADFPG